ncbi:hypothetical protein Hanom_Chr04g00311431 [Helianthus anomalus]
MRICLFNLLLVLRKHATTATVAPKKSDAEKTQSSKVKKCWGREERYAQFYFSDSWCDYVVVSDSLEGLALAVVVRNPKPEPKDTADVRPSNPDDPIDSESSPEHLVRKRAGKRKQTNDETEGQPVKKIQRKKITRKGILDAFMSESAPKIPSSPVSTEPLPVVNEELPPSPSRASVVDPLKNTETSEGGYQSRNCGWRWQPTNP